MNFTNVRTLTLVFARYSQEFTYI
uniref:Uncharacterized protein n=1 Tax=Arundo donax TaxID=35708 RepID=A0A0A9HAI1_ARUDO